MLTSITHNVYARQVSYRRKNSVRAIQQRYFSFVIRCFRRNEQYIQTSLVSKDIAAIKEKLQYDDNLVVQAEIFHLWVIEAPQEIAKEFPADKAGLNVLF